MALKIVWEDILNTAKAEKESLEEFTQAQIDLILAEVEVAVSDTVFLKMAKFAQAKYGAHLAVMQLTPAAGEGTLSSVSIGGVSTSYTMAVNNPTPDQNIQSSIYGREYLRLRNIYCPGILS